jgi:hypothetical protein
MKLRRLAIGFWLLAIGKHSEQPNGFAATDYQFIQKSA